MAASSYYHKSNKWFYIIQIVLLVYALVCLTTFALQINNSVTDTVHHDPPFAGGIYYSLRYVSLDWWLYSFAALRPVIEFLMWSAILFRSSKRYTLFVYIIIVIVTVFELFAVIGHSRNLANCNVSGIRDNPCDSLYKCCAVEIYTTNAQINGCRNVGSPCFEAEALNWPTKLSDLKPNPDFVWTFCMTILFLLMDAFFVVFLSLQLFPDFVVSVRKKNK